MKILILFTLSYVTTSAMSSDISIYEEDKEADICTTEVCKPKNGCRCATDLSPLEPNEQSPQLISLTFNQPVVEKFLKEYWQPILFDRVNPDNQSISGTFFVSHEYTDYDVVNDLYNRGYEIGVHSLTNSALQFYWNIASEELLVKEFAGQRHILSKFGNIPIEDIRSVRTPQLELSGNKSFHAYRDAGLQYDSSWPTTFDKPLYPYTLDYLSSQQCILGDRFTCPNEAFDGFWVLPINGFKDSDGRSCYSFLTCHYYNGTADEITEQIMNEINRIRSTTRVPLTLMLDVVWFEFAENSFEAFMRVLDKLAEYKDVYLVSQKQVVDWMKNPVPLNEFRTDSSVRNATCAPRTCTLTKPNGNIAYMKTCVPCPDSYPWLDNPDGNVIL